MKANCNKCGKELNIVTIECATCTAQSLPKWEKLTKKKHPKVGEKCWTWNGEEVREDEWNTLHDIEGKRKPNCFWWNDVIHYQVIYKPEPPKEQK